MEKQQSISVKDAVHKLQFSLLEGIKNEDQLFAAGSLMSRGDYEDIVTERSISNLCGYPLCNNPLPLEHPRKGRYRVSLKEHKVYDLQETYMYCSSDCVVKSRTFAGSLLAERCSISNSEKINEVLKLFGELSLDEKEDLGKKGDLGFSELKIEENVDVKAGEVLLEDWVGPSNAIEGYVPQRDHSSKSSPLKHRKEGSKSKNARPKKEAEKVVDEMDFTSSIIVGGQFSVPKVSSGPKQNGSETKLKESEGNQFSILETCSASTQNGFETKSKEPKGKGSVNESKRVVSVGKSTQSLETTLKSSLKSSGAKKLTRSVTWADERKIDSTSNGNLCEFQEMCEVQKSGESSSHSNVEDFDGSLRLTLAEAFADALIEAAEAVASGESDATDAVSEAGIIILPRPHDADQGDFQNDEDMIEPEPVPLKWPKKSGVLNSKLFDAEDTWYDTPPEGFSLSLSSFATMWMALFGWITSSSLAYIYGRDESSHEEFSLVNGREYPRKIVLSDGRSSEIKQTLAGCLARALPGLVTDLRLPTPISSLEQGMRSLLETMSFMDALPPFRMKQWHVIVLLLIDALSVCRIPGLIPHMTNRRMLLHKVLDSVQVSVEEYEVMKNLIIPLGYLTSLPRAEANGYQK